MRSQALPTPGGRPGRRSRAGPVELIAQGAGPNRSPKRSRCPKPGPIEGARRRSPPGERRQSQPRRRRQAGIAPPSAHRGAYLQPNQGAPISMLQAAPQRQRRRPPAGSAGRRAAEWPGPPPGRQGGARPAAAPPNPPPAAAAAPRAVRPPRSSTPPRPAVVPPATATPAQALQTQGQVTQQSLALGSGPRPLRRTRRNRPRRARAAGVVCALGPPRPEQWIQPSQKDQSPRNAHAPHPVNNRTPPPRARKL